MAKKVRLEDIARECGVTKGLVSRALAGKYNVGDETRNTIMKKAVELGYDFTKLRSKSKRKTSVVIIVSHTILMKEDFWQPIIKNMYATLNRASIKLEYFVFDSENIDLQSVKDLRDNPCIAFVVLHNNPDCIFKELRKFNTSLCSLSLGVSSFPPLQQLQAHKILTARLPLLPRISWKSPRNHIG